MYAKEIKQVKCIFKKCFCYVNFESQNFCNCVHIPENRKELDIVIR